MKTDSYPHNYPPTADRVFINGTIVTIDKNESTAEAVAVKFGRILAVGSNDEILALTSHKTELTDLQGKTVLPGLIDTHCHMTLMAMDNIDAVDLSEEAGVTSIADIQKKIAEKAKMTPQGEWITGIREDDYKLAEKRHPSRWELDEASPHHPVLIATAGYHFSIANGKALEVAGVTRHSPDPEGGMFERDQATGELTGGLHEEAEKFILSALPPKKKLSHERAAEIVKSILMSNAASGLTCVYDNAGAPQIRAVSDLRDRGELPVRFRVDMDIDRYREMVELGLNHRPFGDEWVKICGLKVFFDGAISARTAAVSEPYLNRPDFYGVFSITRDSAERKISDAVEAGFRVSAHANGDRAISMYLDIIEECLKKYPAHDQRHRIIHCTVVNPGLIERIKELELLPTIFGAYPYYHGDKLLPAFGEQRLEHMFAARSFLDAGIQVSAHSDYDCSPYEPLMGIHALVNRTTKAGKPIGQSQKISVMEAIRLYTINAAWHLFEENVLGSIESGKYADMTVLGENILTVPPETIIDIPVEKTIVGGKIVYQR
ncbi:amidohydrolase [Candidatus Latescibacterota bacterium]